MEDVSLDVAQKMGKESRNFDEKLQLKKKPKKNPMRPRKVH